jgi:hypothetical protein
MSEKNLRRKSQCKLLLAGFRTGEAKPYQICRKSSAPKPEKQKSLATKKPQKLSWPNVPKLSHDDGDQL